MKTPYEMKEPEGLKEYIKRYCARKTYIIVDSKRNTARCTRCGGKWDLTQYWWFAGTDVKHGTLEWCPDCKVDAEIKEARYGRKSLTEYGRILWSEAKGEDTYLELDEYDIDFTGDEVKVWLWPSAQYKISAKEQKYYKHFPEGVWSNEAWAERKKFKLAAPYCTQRFNYPKYGTTHLYHSHLEYGTDLKYASTCIGKFKIVKDYEADFLVGYLYSFIKHPVIEKIEKVGLTRLIQDIALGYNTNRAVNTSAKELAKALKLTPKEIKEAADINISVSQLFQLRSIKKLGIDAKFSDLSFMGYPYRYEKTIDKIKSKTDINVAVKYIRKQNEMLINEPRKAYLNDYADYLEQLEKLEIPLNRKTLRPKDFMKEHERLTSAIKDIEDKLIEVEFKAGELRQSHMTEAWIKDGLIIRPAENPKELSIESENLNHCVKGYKSKVAAGTTSILFIRKEEEPDKPYYTLEFSDGRIVQCRGKCNRSMTEEVEKFTKDWNEWITKKIKEEKRKAV